MTPTTLIETICSVWGISPDRITSQRDGYCEARYMYFWMAWSDGRFSLETIGELNERRYTRQAVHYGIKRHHELLASDAEYLGRWKEVEGKILKMAA